MALHIDILKTFLDEGMPLTLANWMLAQVRHESNNFKSNVFKKNNNLNGYKYVGQALATRGTPAPASEGGYYAKYKTPLDSAKELARWIKRRAKGKKFPADLSTIKTAWKYATLLKACGYYGDSVKNYAAGLERFYKEYSV